MQGADVSAPDAAPEEGGGVDETLRDLVGRVQQVADGLAETRGELKALERLQREHMATSQAQLAEIVHAIRGQGDEPGIAARLFRLEEWVSELREARRAEERAAREDERAARVTRRQTITSAIVTLTVGLVLGLAVSRVESCERQHVRDVEPPARAARP